VVTKKAIALLVLLHYDAVITTQGAEMNEHDFPDEQEGYETDAAGTFKG
jgi:hypothetical protein